MWQHKEAKYISVVKALSNKNIDSNTRERMKRIPKAVAALYEIKIHLLLYFFILFL